MRPVHIVIRALACVALALGLPLLSSDAYLTTSEGSVPVRVAPAASLRRPLSERIRSALDARRPAPEAAPELLLVDSGSAPAEADVAALLSALEEFGSERIVVGPAVLAMTERRSERGRRDAEALIETEFEGIERNLRASFDAIRYGSVRPKDAPAFIDDLAGLVGASGARLRTALLDDDRETPNQAARSLALFDGRRLDEAGALAGALGPDRRGDGGSLVIVDAVPPRPDFQRRLTLAEALGYARLDEIVYERLLDLEKAGYMLGMSADDHPVIAYDYAARLRADALERAGPAVAWRAARVRYVAALLAFPSREAELLRGFDELVAASERGEADAKEAGSLREACARGFAALRAEAWRFAAERERLAALAGGATAVVAATSEIEPLATRLNAALAGRTLSFPAGLDRRLWLALPGLLVAATAPLGPLVTAAVAGSAALAGLGAYAVAYLELGLWLDPPLAALVAVACGLASIGLWALLGAPARRRTRTLLARRVSRTYLRRLERRGEATPEGTRPAAILALRDASAPPDTAAGRAEALARFHGEASALLADSGAVVICVDEALVAVAFGTPLDAPSGRGRPATAPALAAQALAERLVALGAARGSDWRAGLSYGECAFFASALDGYGCVGAPFTHAKALASLAQRYEAGMLLSEGFRAALGSPRLRRLDCLVDKGTGLEEAFYRVEAPTSR